MLLGINRFMMGQIWLKEVAIMLAHHLYKNEKNDEILKLISAKNGVLIACEFDDLLFKGSEKYTEAIDFFKEILGVKAAKKARKMSLKR